LVIPAVLPAVCTIFNALAGFASIHFATKDALGEAKLANLEIAAWLIGVGMLFDMLDGRLARIARRTSDFGAQLDSMCDVITFGAAPAILMLRTVTAVLRGQIDRIDVLLGGTALERTIWSLAALYMTCAALRLARYNVETESDQSAHMTFRGLASPGAAAAIATLVLLFTYLAEFERGWRSSTWLLVTVSITLPVVTLIVALLMVSTFEYPHVVNYYLRRNKRFSSLVRLVIFILAAILNLYITAALLAVVYAFSGPIRALWGGWRKGKSATETIPGARP
jgi:CDP-diacylglycerol--serine O-phosphatidyltransferase